MALKEASESVYWLEILEELRSADMMVVQLKSEGVELRNLLQSILASSKRTKKL